MTTKEKALFIQKIDFIVQDDEKNSDYQEFVDHLEQIYQSSKGRGNGWTGIAEKDSGQIERLYPVVLAFANRVGLE